MKPFILILSLSLLSCRNTIYVVRHAEKVIGNDMVTMKPYTDPPLTREGEQRALHLKQLLAGKNVKHIYSTNTLRTISTAKPLKETLPNVPIMIYSSKADSLNVFIQQIKTIRKGDVLIVGHSNTVDDIANKITGKNVVPADLKDSEYDNLYILKRKHNVYQFKSKKYGVPSK